jgi:nicotinamide mononucleotide transporter
VAVTEVPPGPLQLLAAQAAATPPLEAAAVLLGFAYVILAIRQRRSCWIAGGLSTALYVLVFLDARLYLQSALQVAYVLLAVYGWREWGGDDATRSGLSVRAWDMRRHLAMMAGTGVATLASAPLLAAWSDSAAPWADAFGTWASLAATWMMVRKVAASWIWWIVVDAGLAWLFASQGLVFTAALYAAFAFLAVAGWRAWHAVRTPA